MIIGLISGSTSKSNPGTQPCCVPALFAPQHRRQGY